MSREIKFMAFNTVDNTMSIPDTIRNPVDTEAPGDIPCFILMEYTGAKAVSNNQDVYEGYICTATFKTKVGIENLKGKIVMDEFMWCLETDDNFYSLNRITIIDVIGNIYENPELLKP